MGSVRASYSFSASEGSFDAAGNSARGFDFDLAVDFADTITGSPSSLYSVQGSATGYTALPWGKHVLALRAGGGTAAGTYARGGAFSTGGYDLKTNDLFRTLTTGALNGAVALRGYAPRAFVGRSYLLLNAEYRAPLYQPDRGISTLPVYLRRIDAAGFVDVGGAFDKLDLSDVTFFSKGAFLDPAVLHASAGLELWLGVTVAYVWNAQLRLGYAQGFDSLALRDGKTYFVASTAF